MSISPESLHWDDTALLQEENAPQARDLTSHGATEILLSVNFSMSVLLEIPGVCDPE